MSSLQLFKEEGERGDLFFKSGNKMPFTMAVDLKMLIFFMIFGKVFTAALHNWRPMLIVPFGAASEYGAEVPFLLQNFGDLLQSASCQF